MQTGRYVLNRRYYALFRPLRMAAAAACLWPAVAAAGPPNPTGSDANGNTAAGSFALQNVTGSGNTAIGTDALRATTNGFYNTASGNRALGSNTTGGHNTANGYQALTSNTTGSFNTASGMAALGFNASGNWNTANGYNALYSNTTGFYNTANGAFALRINREGNWNTADGYEALTSNNGGGYNTASGHQALYGNTNGGYNTGSGAAALFKNTTGGYNTGVGAEALYSNALGLYNTVVGAKALRTVAKSTSNVAVGYSALFALAGTSSGNIALGTNAGHLTKGGNNNIYIGNYGIAATESNVTRIGRTTTKVFVKGIAGAPLSGAHVVINSAGQLGVVASSARYKQDIKPLTDASERLSQLRPVSYSYKAEPGTTHYGLIAEEVDRVMPELVVRDEQNRPESVQYLELIPLLLQERQELRAELLRQRALIEQQAKILAELQRTLNTRFVALEATSASNE